LKVDPWWVSTINIGYEAAHGIVEKDGRAKGYTICATKSVKATPERCQTAFADAKALDAWLGPKHVADIKDGGAFSNADGNRATVKKVNPGKTIKLIWQQPDAAPDTPVEVKFQPAGAKTTVMVTHERLQTRADADGFRRAWGEALERLKAAIEA
ncbi:MAG TPA: SRPBCC domain-containing protein, partial [Arenimonas sp.]|nr:SRPBCC domain-containing protein [Arenimonas sp.]